MKQIKSSEYVIIYWDWKETPGIGLLVDTCNKLSGPTGKRVYDYETILMAHSDTDGAILSTVELTDQEVLQLELIDFEMHDDYDEPWTIEVIDG